MKYLKPLILCALLFLLISISSCSGDISGTTANGVQASKTSGKSLVDDLQISKDILDQGQPSVAYDPDNNQYLVVWQHVTITGASEIRGRLYAGTGTGNSTAITPSGNAGNPAGDEFIISTGTGTRQQPKVAYSTDPANPRYLVVWTDSRNRYGQIYGIFFDPRDGSLTAEYPVSTHSADDINQTDPDLVYNSVLKKFIVAWVDTTNADNSSNPANRLNIQGSSCSNSIDVPYIPLPLVDNYMVRSIEIDPSDAGGLLAANQTDWSAIIGGGPIAYVDEAGVGGSYQYVWTAFSGESKPKVNYSITDGTYYAVWSGNNYSVTLDGTYTATKGVESIMRNKTGGGMFIAGNSESVTSGNFIAKADITLLDGTAATSVSVIGLNTNNVTVIIAAGSNLIGQAGFRANLTLTGADTCTYKPVLFAAGAPSGQLITTAKNDGLGLIKLFYFGSVGSNSPSFALDPNTNRLLLAWEDSTQVIKGKLMDASTFTDYKDISISTKLSTSPVVSFDNVNQRFLVAWEDARNASANISNMDIYAQFIDPQGNLSGGNTIVTVAPGNQLAPAMVFGGPKFRQFMVVWKDGRASGNADIWGQMMEFSTLPQLVIADSSNNPILNGAINFGNVALGQTKDMLLKLRNDGNTQLTINSDITKTILPAMPFSLLTPLPSVISPGTTFDITVRFAPTAVGAYAGTSSNEFKLQIDSNGGQNILYLNGAGTGTDPLTIKTTTLPDGTPGVAYPATVVTGFGGVYPYQWTEPGGVLASLGLTINKDTGAVSGTVTPGVTEKIYLPNVVVTDKAGTEVSKTISLRIGAVSITTTTLNGATAGNFYSQTIATTGGAVPFAWSVSAGLPGGLAIDALTGVISGIPSGSGTFNFTVTVTDKNGAFSSRLLSIEVQQSTLAIATSSVPDMKTGILMSLTLQASGGTLPYSWFATKLPGLELDLNMNGGNLSGTPKRAGDYSFEVTVTDAIGSTTKKLYTCSVRDPLNITSTYLKSWAVSQAGYADTLTATGGRGTYTWSVTTGTLPTGLSLNSSTGVISGTPTAAGINSFTVQVADSGTVKEAVAKQMTIVISSAMVISNASAPTATKYAPYSLTLSASGGTDPKTWSSTTLPSGLYLNAQTGVISGNPSEVGLAAIIFTVTDFTGANASKTLNIDVKPRLQITSNSIKPWTAGVGGYNDTLTAIGGTAPYKWEWSEGWWYGNVQGLVLDSATGQISGTPTTIGNYSVYVTLTDANGATDAGYLGTTINKPMTIATTLLSPATPGILYQGTLNMNGGTAPFVWQVVNGSLPSGLSIDPGGNISGIPSTPGNYSFTVQVTDATGSIKSQQLSITVAQALQITSPSSLPQAVMNASYGQTLTATGGRLPYAWSILQTIGSLPAGLSINKTTGYIGGTVASGGTYNFIVQVVDADGRSATQTATISTSSATSPPLPLVINTTSLSSGRINTAYPTTTLSATGGSKPYTWSVVAGTLPPGLGLSSITGTLSGTPTLGGSYDLIVQVMDSELRATTQALSIVVLDATTSDGTVIFLEGVNQISQLSFGNHYITSSAKKKVSVRNTTNSTIFIDAAASSNPAFYISGAQFSIPANGSTDLEVIFNPKGVQAYSGTLTLSRSNGLKYQLPVSGAGIGTNVEVASGIASVSYVNSLSAQSLPSQNRPASYIVSGVTDFILSGVAAYSTVTVSVTFNSMPSSPVFYKLVNNQWKQLANATVSGKVVTFSITDNDPEMDSDMTAGVIRDPVIVGTTSSISSTDTATPSSSGGGGGGCFIATAAFGSYLDPHVMVLRHLRDDVLLKSQLGTAFVRFYYKHSPPVADFISEHESLRIITRWALTPLIVAVKFPLAMPFLLIAISFVAWTISNRRRAVARK